MIGKTTWGALIAFTLAACGGDVRSEFVGTWLEDGPGGQEAEWVFAEDGSLTWNVVGQPSGGFDGLSYEIVSTGNPYEVDITGFDEGPMAGQALYCVAVFPSDQTMRLDCEPGSPEDGASRPTSFSDEALDLTRREENREGADTTGAR